ncbi:MAG: hypothetical protein LBR57_02120 [Alistipes sp.]|jgi:hypothetical protein|nr:hypothetical protein [Alistipes sp.]
MVKLKGSSMLEAIVASLIFLLVFAISLSTLTRLSLRDDEGIALLEAERALTDCFARHSTRLPGIYTDTFEWGEVTTTIATYGDYAGIRQVALTATITGSRKTLEYRRLVATPQ